MAPIIATALLDRFDSAVPVSIYVAAMLALSAVCLLLAPETARADLDAPVPVGSAAQPR